MKQTLIETLLLSQIVILYGFAAPAAFRLMLRSFRERNPEWLALHPEMDIRFLRLALANRMSYLIGGGWLVYVVGGILNGSGAQGSDPALVPSVLGPMLSWIALELLVGALAERGIGRHIPAPTRRKVTLEARRLADFAHPGWLVPGLLVLVLVCAGYAWGAWQERVGTELLSWRLGSLMLVVFLWLVFLRYSVRRRRQTIDETLGPAYRRAEVLGTVACLYLFALVAVSRALQDLFGIALLDDVVFFIGASALLQATLLVWLQRMAAQENLKGIA